MSLNKGKETKEDIDNEEEVPVETITESEEEKFRKEMPKYSGKYRSNKFF